MDIITQGLLGAVASQSIAPKNLVRSAIVIGFFSGMLADTDVLLSFTHSTLQALTYHRHFTHSLIFIPVGGFIAAMMLYLFFRHHIRFKQLFLLATIAYATSGLLDACTSYGTHLGWPFSDYRTHWNIIAIVDPVFSIVLIIAIISGFRLQKTTPAHIGMFIAISYLCLGWWQHHRATVFIEHIAKQRHHTIERLEVKPTMGNIILWRTIYQAEGHYYIDAVHTGWQQKQYQGAAIAQWQPEKLTIPESSQLSQDIHLFSSFSDQYLVVHPKYPNVIGDIRYAMLPDSIVPLWGIEINVKNPHEASEYKNFRTFTQEMRAHFIDMLVGR